MVRYVSNAGLVVVAEGRGVGIDCFARDSKGLYPDTPEAVREELWKDIEEERIHTLIFTHEHEDHFCPRDVLEAWNRNKKLKIYGTKAVISALREARIDKEALVEVAFSGAVLDSEEPMLCGDSSQSCGDGSQADRLPVETNGEGNTTWVDFPGLRIGFLPTKHEGEQYAHVENLTLLMEKGEKRIVLAGDAAPTPELFDAIAAWSKELTGFFVPFPYVGLGSVRKQIAEKLVADKIFVLHQPRKEADTQGWIASAKKVCEHAKDGLAMPFFPGRIGDWYYL